MRFLSPREVQETYAMVVSKAVNLMEHADMEIHLQPDGDVERGSTEMSDPADDLSDEDRPPQTPKKKKKKVRDLHLLTSLDKHSNTADLLQPHRHLTPRLKRRSSYIKILHFYLPLSDEQIPQEQYARKAALDLRPR
ncbi:uncharacterized protein LOC144025514 isoform X1 [Festucalex cinctus]